MLLYVINGFVMECCVDSSIYIIMVCFVFNVSCVLSITSIVYKYNNMNTCIFILYFRHTINCIRL